MGLTFSSIWIWNVRDSCSAEIPQFQALRLGIKCVFLWKELGIQMPGLGPSGVHWFTNSLFLIQTDKLFVNYNRAFPLKRFIKSIIKSRG